MEVMSSLQFAALSEQTRNRWQKLLSSARPQLTDRCRRLLQIGIDAVESHGPNELQARLHGGCLWLCCQQSDLARLLECSDRTVRHELERLDSCGALQTFPHPSKPNVIGYRIDPEVLESIPESHTPDLDEIICAFAEQTTDANEAQPEAISPETETTDSGLVSAGFSGPISGGISGHFSGPISAPVSAPVSVLMNHDHERMNYLIPQSHDHERTRDETKRARFDSISERDIRGIAGFMVEVDGRSGVPNPRSRLMKLREYFDDAVAAGLASETEFPIFGALFRHVGRRTDVKLRANYLRTLWTNRDDRPLTSVVTRDDREYFRQLSDSAQLIPS